MAGVSITVGGNFTKLDELKSKAQGAAKDVKKAFDSDLGKKMFAGVSIAAAAAFAGVVTSIKSALDAGGGLSDMMARTGAEGKGLFVMQRAFENAGIAAGNVPQALNKMQKALAGVNEEGDPTNAAFAKLGLSISNLTSMDPVAAFRKISEAIAGIDDPARRTAVAMEIFGKSAGELLVLMTDSKAFSGAEEQVGSLGQTLADNAAAFDTISDSLGLNTVKLQQMGAEIAVALLPQLTSLAEWLNETDFAAIGTGIGDVISKMMSWGDALGDILKQLPTVMAMNKAMELLFGGAPDPAKAKAMAIAMGVNFDYKKGGTLGEKETSQSYIEKPSAPQVPAKSAKEVAKEADATARAAEAANKKAEADREAAEEKAKSRAAAMDEYNVESAILTAKLAGNAKLVESLEREKKIREEMAKLTRAGFSEAESRTPAEKAVDAQAKLDAQAKEAQAKLDAQAKAKEDKDKAIESAKSQVDDAQKAKDDLQYQSSIGAANSMQRIGGGGSAVSSGLDYQRQAADLQRQSNDLLRQLISLSRSPLE